MAIPTITLLPDSLVPVRNPATVPADDAEGVLGADVRQLVAEFKASLLKLNVVMTLLAAAGYCVLAGAGGGTTTPTTTTVPTPTTSTTLTYTDAFPTTLWPAPTVSYPTTFRTYAAPTNLTWETTKYYHDGNKTLNANGEFVISGRSFADYGVDCCLLVNISSPVVVDDCNFTGTPYQAFMSLRSPNIKVRNCRCFGLPIPDGNNYSPGVFLDCDNQGATVKNLLVEHNFITGAPGIRLQAMSDNTNKFLVRYNEVRNINTVKGTGYRDYKSSFQLLNCPSIWIDLTRNQVYNQQGLGNGEDQFNLYSAVGTAEKPIRMFDNAIFGAFSNDLSSGNNGFTGTGGTTDLASGGSLIPQFIYVYGNQFVRTANSAFNTAGGHDIYVYHNRAITYGRFEDGTPIGQQSTGVAIFDYYQTGASNFYNNHTVNNLLGYFTWFNDRRDNFLGVAATDNLHLADPITLNSEYYERQLWEQKKAGWLAADSTAVVGNL